MVLYHLFNGIMVCMNLLAALYFLGVPYRWLGRKLALLAAAFAAAGLVRVDIGCWAFGIELAALSLFCYCFILNDTLRHLRR